MKKLLFLIIFVPFSFNVMAGGRQEREVNIYTDRHYSIDDRVYELFEERTGIRVNSIASSGSPLIERLRVEGEETAADLFFATGISTLYQAKQLGVLQSVDTELVRSLPAHLRDPEGHWVAVTKRGRVIAYHKERVDPSMLSTYEALTNERWKGKILTRTSQHPYNISLFSSIIVHNGVDFARQWAEGIVANLARIPQGNDRDQMKAIAAGIGDIALVNTYYVGLLLSSEDEAEREVGNIIGLYFPNQDGRGAHINISGIGVTRYAAHKNEAIEFIEFLLTEEVQRMYAENNYEFPVIPDVAAADIVRQWGEFEEDSTNLGEIGKHAIEAAQILNEVGWQ